MKKFKVLKGNVGGYGNRKYKIGDIVNENDFIPGTAKTLCDMGFLGELDEDDDEHEEVNDEEELLYMGALENDMTKTEVIDELTRLEVEFNKADKKSVLFALLVEQVEPTGPTEGEDKNPADILK